MSDRNAAPQGDPPPDPDRMLAAEYALGVLEGDEREAAARRVERDPAFARAVDDWHAQLEPMLDYVEDAVPSPRVWRGIEAAIGRADARRPRAIAPAQAIVRQGVPAWRAFLLMVMGGALAALMLVALVDLGHVRLGPGLAPTGPAEPALVATLTPEGAAPPALARFDPSGGLTVRITLAGTDDRVPELWLIPGDGVPRSLGVITGDGATIALPEGIAPLPGEALAVSLEPPGGSPTGAPTGPVVASGQLVAL